MKRLFFSSRALWHGWRAYRLTIRAERLFDAGEAHGILADGYKLSARYMARVPLPSKDDGENLPPSGCSFAGQMLLASIIGLGIAALWIWISARAGR
jgi:hypothetical protein